MICYKCNSLLAIEEGRYKYYLNNNNKYCSKFCYENNLSIYKSKYILNFKFLFNYIIKYLNKYLNFNHYIWIYHLK